MLLIYSREVTVKNGWLIAKDVQIAISACGGILILRLRTSDLFYALLTGRAVICCEISANRLKRRLVRVTIKEGRRNR